VQTAGHLAQPTGSYDDELFALAAASCLVGLAAIQLSAPRLARATVEGGRMKTVLIISADGSVSGPPRHGLDVELAFDAGSTAVVARSCARVRTFARTRARTRTCAPARTFA